MAVDTDSTESAEVARRALLEGRALDAAGIYVELVRMFPGVDSFHGNLGVALRRLGRLDAAIASYRRATALAPDSAGLLSNLGNALRASGQLEEALAVQQHAFDLTPDAPLIRYNLALTLRDCRKFQEATSLLINLVGQLPENAEYTWDLAVTRLKLGDYLQGFHGFEARWKLPGKRTTLNKLPQWSGDDIAGRSIFLQSEQGFGDALQFVRFVPPLAKRGARIILESLPQLVPLFTGVQGVEQVVAKGAPAPMVDISTPLLSLPRLFRTTLETLPASVPYLRAPGAMQLPKPPGACLRAGLVWAGKPTPRSRSWPLTTLAPLLANPHVSFFSLQVGPHANDLAETGMGHLIYDLGPQLLSFADTAAAMQELDLIITVDTAAAHLAGALGRPVWVLLRYVSDWRWFEDREDSPWYPTMRLFRQSRPDDFAGPVERVCEELARATGAAARRSAASTLNMIPRVKTLRHADDQSHTSTA
jgi:tetratricopeptide repeat protein/glycosyl transferase family 9 (putative heptosyltransferase)